MSHKDAGRTGKVRKTRFPISLFFIFFGILLLMSGVHMGIIVLMNEREWHSTVQVVLPLLYWMAVALGMTLYTKWRVKKTYEAPMQRLAEATEKVAGGDFSVFVPTNHTAARLDYIDIMILNFNKMVEELGSIETLKTDFFSNVSHEIKTPLAVIQNHAELLGKEGLSPEKQREYTEVILQATKRLSALITNMLKLNKLEKQAIKPLPQSYDLPDQLCRCALQFEEQWEKKKIEFTAELEDRALIEADPGLLEMVWNNLFSNAIKFTPPGGSVTLSQTSDADTVYVSVSDTGCGMSEETMAHIFDKFYQGDLSHSTEGNGLGLALVKRILELTDGTISVRSEPGRGSVFTVALPVSREDKRYE